MPCGLRIVSIALAIQLCCTPELLFSATSQSPQAQNQEAGAGTGSPTPSTVPSAIPDAPSQAQENSAAPANTTPARQDSVGQQEPEGTAAARAAKTIGGPASKPAGSAIAPAKQRQIRSLLIKIGVIAGAGAALGTVYALTRGTPSKPPGAH